MEKVLNKILEKLDSMESDLKEIKSKIEEIYSLKPLIGKPPMTLGFTLYNRGCIAGL
ncbi:MAG: hypothetical protein ACYDG6_14480 [Thermincolia bacterium]